MCFGKSSVNGRKHLGHTWARHSPVTPLMNVVIMVSSESPCSRLPLNTVKHGSQVSCRVSGVRLDKKQYSACSLTGPASQEPSRLTAVIGKRFHVLVSCQIDDFAVWRLEPPMADSVPAESIRFQRESFAVEVGESFAEYITKSGERMLFVQAFHWVGKRFKKAMSALKWRRKLSSHIFSSADRLALNSSCLNRQNGFLAARPMFSSQNRSRHTFA